MRALLSAIPSAMLLLLIILLTSGVVTSLYEMVTL